MSSSADVPSNAPEHCPGTASEQAGKASACQGCPNQAACASAPKGPDPDMEAIARRMAGVKHKLLVLSGKGGVGKSTFSAQLAFALAAQGKEVGLLDIDICGPSMPKMLGLEGHEVHQSNAGWSPVYVEDNLGVMSIGFMLPDPDEAVIWRGPRKNGLIKQFLKDVDWGTLDYLVVDAPPGTSDEHITIAQCLKADSSADGAIIVTTPQEVSIIDVRKEINFCKKVGLPVLGVVENMSGLQQRVAPGVQFLMATTSNATAPGAANVNATSTAMEEDGADGTSAAASTSGMGAEGGHEDVTEQVLEVLRSRFGEAGLQALMIRTEVFQATAGGAERMCQDMGVRLLGRVPLDPGLGRAAEEGRAALGAGASLLLPSCAAALSAVVEKVVSAVAM